MLFCDTNKPPPWFYLALIPVIAASFYAMGHWDGVITSWIGG